ncbi:MAG TPA: hypothetical protein VL943_09240, partial [Niabella sp.]|nr:hypothetical protein [Niabella sp.]
MSRLNIALICALAVCIVIIFWPGKDDPGTHATDNAIVQADNKIIIEQRNAGLKKIDSLETVIKKRDTIIN